MIRESPAPVPEAGFPPPVRVAPLRSYAAMVIATSSAIFGQYLVPNHLAGLDEIERFALGLGIAYGVPIGLGVWLLGSGPLSRYFANFRRASLEGLRWYGIASVLALAILFLLAIVYLIVAPQALSKLEAPNPALTAAKSNPWFWVGFSFVVGFLEETIFRGWIFGYWLSRGSSLWAVHAVWTSLLFAGVHLYYGTTYGAASPFAFSQLMLAGLGFAFAYRYSGGNIAVVASLHGATDSIAFLSLISPTLSILLHWLLVGVGALVALVLFVSSRPKEPTDATAFHASVSPRPELDSSVSTRPQTEPPELPQWQLRDGVRGGWVTRRAGPKISRYRFPRTLFFHGRGQRQASSSP